MRWKTLVRVMKYSIVLSLGVLAYLVGSDAALLRNAAQSYLDEYGDLSGQIAAIRDDYASLAARDPEGVKAFNTLATEAQRSVEQSNRIAKGIVEQNPLSLSLSVLFSRTRRFTEFTDAMTRTRESLTNLNDLKKDLQAELDEVSGEKCYCSCTGPGGATAKKGRKTAQQCGEICRDEQFTQATCM